MPRPGYNVYVMGEPGTGRFSFVRRYLKAEGKRLQTPSDWVYVNNFNEPREPRVLELPYGGAAGFIADINQLIDNLLATFPAVFEHPSFQQKKSAIDRAFNQRYDKALDVIEACAREGNRPLPRQHQYRLHPDEGRQGAGRDRIRSAAGSRARALPRRYFRAGSPAERRAGQPPAVEARVHQPVAPAQ